MPHFAGSVSSSPTSTSRTKGVFASFLRSMMLTSRPVTPAVTTATTSPSAPSRIRKRLLLMDRNLLRFPAVGGANAGARAVADRRVAVHADRSAVFGARRRDQLVDHAVMAVQAALLQNAGVLLLDHDRLVEVLQREALRMVVAVLGLGDVLADVIVRQVAVDAGRDAMVAGFLPRVVLRVHDVAVRAGHRIAAQVGQALGVAEGEPGHFCVVRGLLR